MAEPVNSTAPNQSFVSVDESDRERFAAALQQAEEERTSSDARAPGNYSYNPLGNGIQMLYDSRASPGDLVLSDDAFLERARERLSVIPTGGNNPNVLAPVETKIPGAPASTPGSRSATPAIRDHYQALEDLLSGTPGPRVPPTATFSPEDAIPLREGIVEGAQKDYLLDKRNYDLIRGAPAATQKILRGVGTVGTLAGGIALAGEVIDAPAGQKGRPLAGGVGGMIGGSVGGSVGWGIGSGAAGLASPLLLPIIGSGPVGVGMVAGGLAGSVIVGGFGDRTGQRIGTGIYDFFDGAPSSPEEPFAGSDQQPMDQWWDQSFGGPVLADPAPPSTEPDIRNAGGMIAPPSPVPQPLEPPAAAPEPPAPAPEPIPEPVKAAPTPAPRPAPAPQAPAVPYGPPPPPPEEDPDAPGPDQVARPADGGPVFDVGDGATLGSYTPNRVGAIRPADGGPVFDVGDGGTLGSYTPNREGAIRPAGGGPVFDVGDGGTLGSYTPNREGAIRPVPDEIADPTLPQGGTAPTPLNPDPTLLGGDLDLMIDGLSRSALGL